MRDIYVCDIFLHVKIYLMFFYWSHFFDVHFSYCEVFMCQVLGGLISVCGPRDRYFNGEICIYYIYIYISLYFNREFLFLCGLASPIVDFWEFSNGVFCLIFYSYSKRIIFVRRSIIVFFIMKLGKNLSHKLHARSPLFVYE